jgi:hypothetical protein
MDGNWIRLPAADWPKDDVAQVEIWVLLKVASEAP